MKLEEKTIEALQGMTEGVGLSAPTEKLVKDRQLEFKLVKSGDEVVLMRGAYPLVAVTKNGRLRRTTVTEGTPSEHKDLEGLVINKDGKMAFS